MKKRKDVKYLFQSGNRLEVRTMTPEIRFVFDVFQSGAVQNLNVSNLKQNIRELLGNVEKPVRELINLRYGLESGISLSYDKMQKVIDLPRMTIVGRTARGVRKLETYKNILCEPAGCVPSGDKIEFLFADDLRKFMQNQKTVFLESVLHRRNIRISIQKTIRKKRLPELSSSFSLMNAKTSELYLSAETMQELRQNGLTEVRNILLMKQLSEIISESAYHELMKKLELFRKNADAEQPDYYTVIEISMTEQETTRKTELCFDGDSVSQSLVLNRFYELLCNREQNGLNLFDVEVSLSLKNLLLMKGYFYLTDIFQDSEALMSEFQHSNRNSFLLEFENLLQSGTASAAYINEQTIAFLECCHIDSVSKLRECSLSSPEKQKIQEQLLNWCNANILYHINGAYHGDMSAVLIPESGGMEDDR